MKDTKDKVIEHLLKRIEQLEDFPIMPLTINKKEPIFSYIVNADRAMELEKEYGFNLEYIYSHRKNYVLQLVEDEG